MEWFTALVVIIITFVMSKLYFDYQSKPKCIIHDGICTKIAVTAKQCIDLINELESHQPEIVGFDIEWSSKTTNNSTNNNKVSLLQIGHTNLIILIRLNLIKNIPGKLHDFLGNIKILKAGIGIYEDRNKLEKDYNLCVHGCVDINHIFNNKLSNQQRSKLKATYYNKEINDLTKQEQNNTFGLNSMCCLLFNSSMKYKNVKYTFHEQWNNNKLSVQHLHYAADDALVGYKLFIKLMSVINDEKTVEENDSFLTICYGLIDIKHRRKSNSKISKSKIHTQNTGESDTKKKSEETVIQNCIVCDSEEKLCDLRKHHIVPTQFFRYMKRNSCGNTDLLPSNNTILTCKLCKKLCTKNADDFRDELCRKYNIPLISNKTVFFMAKIAAYDLIDYNMKYKRMKQCPGMHGLKTFVSEHNGYTCDGCEQPMDVQQLWGCRDCNYDLCDNCYTSGVLGKNESIRYKLPIDMQINMLKNICCYYNLLCETVYKENEESDEKKDYEYKWQRCSGKGFKDYENDESMKIENEYIRNKSEMQFEKQFKKKVKTYCVNFGLMQQENVQTERKRDVRRIYKDDNDKLKKWDVNSFDHLIEINYNKCCIDITTNEIILCCIDDIIENGNSFASLLQKERYDMQTKCLVDFIKDPNIFIQIWKENFMNNVKPKNYRL